MRKLLLFGTAMVALILVVWQWQHLRTQAGITTYAVRGQRPFPTENLPITRSDAPIVKTSQPPAISPAVRELPPPQITIDYGPKNDRRNPNTPITAAPFDWQDPLLQPTRTNSFAIPSPILAFSGISLTSGGSGVPPDTNGAVGPHHYVQMVNTAFAIYDKNGNLLEGPHLIYQLWSGETGSCASENGGDPVVIYDWQAQRWLLSQFPFSNSICIAVSRTADPTGDYFLYQFNFDSFPDYFKIGVWRDAYYITANQSGHNVHAVDRSAMLSGLPATVISFVIPSPSPYHNMLLPSSLEGDTPPPAGSPNVLYRFVDDATAGGIDRLELYAFHVDFTNPGNATITGPQTIATAPFAALCNYSWDCIAQPDTTRRLDSITDWPMWRLQYRNFGSHESLVGNHAVNVGSDRAGIRWFELRKIGVGGWSLYQEGTFAPNDGHSRWMASIALDGAGNMAMGYSVSSASLYPSVRYAMRLASNQLGTFAGEAELKAGSGSQTGTNRWGDYSALVIDPADDCTFWYTNEYYATTSNRGWSTVIGAFKIPGCGEVVVLDEFRYLPLIMSTAP